MRLAARPPSRSARRARRRPGVHRTGSARSSTSRPRRPVAPARALRRRTRARHFSRKAATSSASRRLVGVSWPRRAARRRRIRLAGVAAWAAAWSRRGWVSRFRGQLVGHRHRFGRRRLAHADRRGRLLGLLGRAGGAAERQPRRRARPQRYVEVRRRQLRDEAHLHEAARRLRALAARIWWNSSSVAQTPMDHAVDAHDQRLQLPAQLHPVVHAAPAEAGCSDPPSAPCRTRRRCSRRTASRARRR